MKSNSMLPPVKRALPLMFSTSYCPLSSPPIWNSMFPLLANVPLMVSVPGELPGETVASSPDGHIACDRAGAAKETTWIPIDVWLKLPLLMVLTGYLYVSAGAADRSVVG